MVGLCQEFRKEKYEIIKRRRSDQKSTKISLITCLYEHFSLRLTAFADNLSALCFLYLGQ